MQAMVEVEQVGHPAPNHGSSTALGHRVGFSHRVLCVVIFLRRQVKMTLGAHHAHITGQHEQVSTPSIHPHTAYLPLDHNRVATQVQLPL
jgi:hypothetical protein